MTESDSVPKPALLFTDIEGSTQLLERDEVDYRRALEIHHRVLRRIAAENGGLEFVDSGDGLCLAFVEPDAAVRAAVLMQEELSSAVWLKEGRPLRVRMAVHWAAAEFREGQYRGPAMHLTARLLGAANGGQIVCSEPVALGGAESAGMVRLGTYRLRGFSEAVTVYQWGERAFPPLRAAQARRHNLPQFPDVFVGRVSEMAWLSEQLSPSGSARLITLIGAGGLGKSRLALAVAEGLLDAYDHSVLHVSAVSLSSGEGLVETLVKALGAKPDGESWSQLVACLEQTPTLLVLDNLEHLVEESSSIIGRLLRELPLCRVLVTSRLRLGIVGETEFPVRPLGVPGEGAVEIDDINSFEAVTLFVERVGRVRAEFALSGENSSSVAAICRRLGGIPLALELAAARSRVLSIGELETSLANALVEEEGPLEAAFRWSLNMLPPDIRTFLGALSVFRGGWSARAAAEVVAIANPSLSLSYLHYLLTCSLIQAAEVGASMRFNMLEPVRQMLEAQLDPETAREIVARHGAYFITLGRRVNVEFGTPGEESLVKEIEPEVANILAALERESSDEHRLSSAVHFHQYAIYGSCNRALRKILTYRPDEIGEVRVSVLARVATAAGALDLVIRRLESARSSYEQAVELFERCGEPAGAAAARFNLASVARDEGDLEYTNRIFREILVFFRESGDDESCCTVLFNLGLLECKRENFAEAERLQRENLAICQKRGYPGNLAVALEGLAIALIGLSRWEEAMESAAACLDLTLRLQRTWIFSSTLFLLARSAVNLGFNEDCVVFVGASRKAAARLGIPLSVFEKKDLSECLSQATEAMAPAVVAELLLLGEKSQPDDWQGRTKKILDKLQFRRRGA